MLVCMIVAYLIYKAYLDGRTDHEYAKQGLVSPRLQAKYGDGAAAKTARYGLLDYLADAWSDNWRNRTEIRRSAEKAVATVKPSDPARPKPSWRDRLAAAKQAVMGFGKKLIEPVEAKPRLETPKPTTTVDPPAEPAASDDFDRHRTCPDCGARLTETNGGWWHPDGPDCPNEPEPATKPSNQPATEPAAEPDPTRIATKGKPMTTATGEAVNYETTVAELEKLIEACRTWLDQVTAALKSCAEAKNHIEDAQGGYKTAASVAASILDHLAAMSLDTHTLGLIGAIKEALPASDVDVVLALLEEAEEKLKTMQANAQTALDAAQAALTHVVAEYGEEAAKVANNLGGDPTFLGSSGGGSAPAQVSAAA